MDRMPRTATVVISVLTALAWLVAWLIARSVPVDYLLGFVPARFSGRLQVAHAVPTFLTPLTATFVHAGPVHLGFNLLMFIWCGTQVERVLGRTELVFLYIVGAYASALAQWAAAPLSTVPMVGASGAISAVVGAYALSFGRAKRVTNNLWLNRWINVLWLAVAWVVIQWMTGYIAGQQGMQLAVAAHIGGFVAGLLLQRPLLLWHYRKA
jgi:membrane associated rhomboid family serine protease